MVSPSGLIKSGTFASVIFVAILFCSSSYAQKEIPLVPETRSEGALKICAFNWIPYSFEREGKTVGILVELLKSINFSQPTKLTLMPLRRCIAEVRSGQHHMALNVGMDYPELRKSSVVLQYLIAGMIVTESNELKSLRGFNPPEGFTVGFLRGNTLLGDLEKRYPSVAWQPLNSVDSMWRMMMAGRLDAAIGDYTSLAALPIYREGEARFLMPALGVLPLHFAVHNSVDNLIPFLDRSLQTMVENGSVDRAYEQYGIQALSKLERLISEGCAGLQDPIPECV